MLDYLLLTRVVATPAALNAATWPADTCVFRTADDEVLLFLPSSFLIPPFLVSDPHAIIVPDSGFVGAWLTPAEAQTLFEQHCEWAMPTLRPTFAQGAVAGIAAKVWFENDRVLCMVPAAYAYDFEKALGFKP